MKRCLLNPEMAAMGTYQIRRCISMFNRQKNRPNGRLSNVPRARGDNKKNVPKSQWRMETMYQEDDE